MQTGNKSLKGLSLALLSGTMLLSSVPTQAKLSAEDIETIETVTKTAIKAVKEEDKNVLLKISDGLRSNGFSRIQGHP